MSHKTNTALVQAYLTAKEGKEVPEHEKAEESRHNETAAYLMFITSAVFFVGGLLATIYSGYNMVWFIFLPYNLTSHPASFLGLILMLSGIAL